jgi:hypothetical protein
MTQGEFNEKVMRETCKRSLQRKEGGQDSKGVRAVKHGEKEFYYVRWKGMANDGKWFRTGLDVQKTINQLVGGGALVYLVENGEDGKKNKDENWVRVVNLEKTATF